MILALSGERKAGRKGLELAMANLSSKEASALGEQLGTEQVLISKYQGLASQCQDAVIKTKLEQIAARHKQHFDSIVKFLH